MRVLLKNGLVYSGGAFSHMDMSLYDGLIDALSSEISFCGFDQVLDLSDCLILPGLADVHVHLREPGFSYKETIATGTAAAARGGFTAVCSMPNLDPPPDSVENLDVQLDIIDKTALIKVVPYGCITSGGTGRGELVDFQALKKSVAGFSDDGKGVQDSNTMERAMRAIAELGGIVAAHCEDETLLHGGYIHDGIYAKRNGHKGISSESEWVQIERDIELVRKTGCKYHVCHLSTREGVDLIRRAKAEGLPVTCETAPHYLVLCEDDLEEDGRFKMNPPLRSAEDRAALLGGIVDGTVDMIATDHAPHSAEEKGKGLSGSAMGVVGLETALPVVYTELVKSGIITAERLVELMCINPRRRFSLGGGQIVEGTPADFVVFDPNRGSVVDPESFLSKGRATPFAGRNVTGEVIMTYYEGRKVWERDGKWDE